MVDDLLQMTQQWIKFTEELKNGPSRMTQKCQ